MFETKVAWAVRIGEMIRYKGAWYVILSTERIMDRVVFTATNRSDMKPSATIDLHEKDFPGWAP